MRHLYLLALTFGSAGAVAADVPRSLEVVNTPDIVSIAVLDHGSWRSLNIDSSRNLRVASIDLPDAGTCLRDFRTQFTDATALILRDVDTCREHTLDPAFYRPRMHRRHAAGS
jgi:hypothetical protein